MVGEMCDATTEDHLTDELSRVDRLLLSYARAVGQSPEQLSELLGYDSSDARRNGVVTVDSGADTIAERVSATGEANSRLAAVADRFDLSRAAADALVLALAPDIDGRYEQAFGHLLGDTSMRRPTVGLLSAVLRTAGHERFDAMATFESTAPLVQQRLLDIVERGVDTPFRSRIASVSPRVLSFLLGRSSPETLADGRIQRQDCETTLDALCVPDAVTRQLRAVAENATEPGRYLFTGPAGAGGERAVAAVCSTEALLRVEANALVTDPELVEMCVREARLQALPLQVTGIEALAGDDGPATADTEQAAESITDSTTLLETLDDVERDVFLTGETADPVETELTRSVVHVEFPQADYHHREAVWDAHESALPPEVSPSELAATFTLTQGEIRDAITVARNRGVSDRITEAGIYEGCRSQSSSRLEALAERLDPAATWDDIVLPESTERHVREVAARVRDRGSVYGEWGLGEQFTRGKGVVALFAGPSGTGKTMAAEVIANDAGLSLYKIDLSTVVSKYIGETEENLERVFEAAEDSSSILLFDEADAIFGERSSVSDSTDRYANVEVNYLLQRIERYDGVVLLTTNYDQNIDDAFQRRIDLTVDFERPDTAARERLWREMLGGSTPTAGIDYEFLAELTLTGGSIKNAVQSAAFLAANDDDPIRMAHVVPAVAREFEKTGQLLDPGVLGEYREHLAA